MTRSRALTFSVVLLSFCSVVGWAKAPPAAPSFTITASPYTMPSSGDGAIPFTLTSIGGFEGTVLVTCTSPNPPVGVREPRCGYNGGPAMGGFDLTANGTATGYENIEAIYPLPAHEVSRLNHPESRNAARWALAGVLMLGLGLRRKKARQFFSLLILAGVFMGMTACAGPETLTPGVYAYTLTAQSVGQDIPSFVVSTMVNVTVPRGIVIQKAPTAEPASR